MQELNELLQEIEQFCTRHGIAESTFGFRAVNDGKLVARLRKGKTLTMTKFSQIKSFLGAQQEPAE